MNLPNIIIPSGERGSIIERVVEQYSRQHHCARETATFSRFGESRNSIPLGRSSAVEVTIETRTTGASRPWNLSKVPTAIHSSHSCSYAILGI